MSGRFSPLTAPFPLSRCPQNEITSEVQNENLRIASERKSAFVLVVFRFDEPNPLSDLPLRALLRSASYDSRSTLHSPYPTFWSAPLRLPLRSRCARMLCWEHLYEGE